MNPLNTLNAQQSKQYFTTGMPPLAPDTSTSLGNSNSSSTTSATPTTSQTTSITTFCEMNPTTGNNTLDAKYLTKNYVPVLLTNQTIISNVDPLQHQQQVLHQHQQQQNITSTLISGSNAPVVKGNSTSQMPLNITVSKPMIITSSNTSNITYQVLTTPQTNNMTPVMASPNSTVSVLLTPSPQTMTTAGHVAAPIIIRNTPPITTPTAPVGTQIMQHQQQPQKLHQMHAYNPKQMNAEILKHIIVGDPSNATGATTLAPGTTLLKTPFLQNKQTMQQQQKQMQQLNSTTATIQQQLLPNKQQQQQQRQKQLQQQQQKQPIHIVTNKTTISSQPQQHQVVNQLVTNSDNSSKMFANPKLNTQKMPQVSLLQTSKKSLNTTTSTGIINESVSVWKNANEIKVSDLNSEVSLIKKHKFSSEKSKETSLLKNLNATEVLKAGSCSLLKSSKALNKTLEKVTDINKKSEKKFVIDCDEEKQKSLLKLRNIKSNDLPQPQQTSPRTQRSKSCNTLLKTHAASITNMNERRFSEPSQTVQLNNLKTLDFKKTHKQDKQEIDSLKSEELDTLLEEYENEDYLECSGQKSDKTSKDNMSEITEKSENIKMHSEREKEKEIIEAANLKKSETNNQEFNHLPENTDDNNINEIINEEKSSQATDSDNDDVTILPMEEEEIIPIEIDDDDDDEEQAMSENNNSLSSKEKLNESLLCDEQVLVSSSSSISNHSLDQISANSTTLKSPRLETNSSPLLKKTLMEQKSLMPKEGCISASSSNGYPSVLEMLANFNMLNWKERIGSARGTNLKFQLNEFNLLQVYEMGPIQDRHIHTAYEKPIYERESSVVPSWNNKPPIFYMCRRCNVQGPAVDFLAPEFCSLSCLKRDCRKRRDDNACILRKRQRVVPHQNANNTNQPPPLTYISPPKFRWSNYLKSQFNAVAAPISLFLNPLPTGPNNFTVGMKLEAIDPENCSLFCVCTVIETMGYRIKLSFDGYESSYDFWVNADSMDIFPPGWCLKTNRILQPPKGISANKFIWSTYLSKEKALAAPRHLFTHLNSSSLTPRNPFKVGMHLEAEDLNDTGKLCVASIADVLDDRIRIHFDGWDDCYDIIVDINSPYIHPCGWHEGRQQLVVPPDCENTAFNWDDYIRKQGTGEAAFEEIFAPREPINFKPNMKLEVVDPRNPSLIRPATVVTHKGHRVKLHLDGWPIDYCFWLEDDSPDLHPIGWCDASCHDLEPPPGFQMAKQKMPCPVTGCRGIGNAKKPFMSVHASRDCCPYAAENWRIVMERPPRLGFDNIARVLPKHAKITSQTQSQQQQRLSDQQILERIQVLDTIKTRNVLVQQEKLPTNHNDVLGVSLSKIKKEEIKEMKPSKLSLSNSSSSSLSTATAPNKNSEDSLLYVNLDIAKEFLCDYGPRLQQAYSLWQKNFNFDAEKIKRNPLKWSTTEVSVFVDLYLNCRKTATKFNQEDIDGEALLLLQQEDLTDKLGLKLGAAVKLYTCILQLRTLAVTKFDVPYTKKSLNK